MNRSVSASAIGNGPSAKSSGSQQQPTAQPSVSNIVCRSITAKSSPTTMRMCPPATLRNWKFHKPLLAVGNVSGLVQIFNLATGQLFRELCVHSYAVRGIEWIGLNAFVSYAMSESFQGNDINWELHITELDTGRTVQLKSGRSSENSVIKSVKASHQRQYFIIIYQSDPFEIWSLDTLSLLKRVPKEFSGIVAAEWSPLYSKRVDTSQLQTESTDLDPSRLRPAIAPWRENFVVTNKKGELFHFSIAGNVVKELSKIPPETTINKSVTAIAWKSDHVVLGRNDGSLSVWDLGEKESRTVATMRGAIRRIRFAPGRGNMKIIVLFEEGIEVWDVRCMRLISSANSPKTVRIEDTDWGSSDRPVILNSNGTIVVTDITFRQFSALLQEVGQYRAHEPNPQSHNADPCYLQ